MRVLVHDGIGIWSVARRLNQGKFNWPGTHKIASWNWIPSSFRLSYARLEDGALLIDNIAAENQFRRWALDIRAGCLPATFRSEQRATAVMSLIQTARFNRHDPYAYLKDVLTSISTQRVRLANCFRFSG